MDDITQSKHRGAVSELIAVVWLLNQGYDVFRNVSDRGHGDIVARDPETGKLQAYDVKTITLRTLRCGTETATFPVLFEWQQDVLPIYVSGADGRVFAHDHPLVVNRPKGQPGGPPGPQKNKAPG